MKLQDIIDILDGTYVNGHQQKEVIYSIEFNVGGLYFSTKHLNGGYLNFNFMDDYFDIWITEPGIGFDTIKISVKDKDGEPCKISSPEQIDEIDSLRNPGEKIKCRPYYIENLDKDQGKYLIGLHVQI